MKKVEIKFTKNGKNYAIKNLPINPKGVYSKVLETEIRFNPVKGDFDKRGQKYPEVKVNGEWINMHEYVLENEGVEVPRGYNRHHIDQNPLNNTIQNIAVVDKNEHLRLHNKYDVENGEATEYPNIVKIPSGGFKYIDLDADDEAIWKYDKIFARSVPQLVRKLRAAGIKVSKN